MGIMAAIRRRLAGALTRAADALADPPPSEIPYADPYVLSAAFVWRDAEPERGSAVYRSPDTSPDRFTVTPQPVSRTDAHPWTATVSPDRLSSSGEARRPQRPVPR